MDILDDPLKQYEQENEDYEGQELLSFFQELDEDLDEIDEEITAKEEDEKLGDWEFISEILTTFRLMNSSLNLKAVLEHVMDAAISVIQAERGFLVLKNPDGEFEFKIARDAARNTLTDSEFQVSQSFLQQAIDTKKMAYVEDALTDQDYSPTQSVQQLKLRSIVCCPMLFNEELLGVIYADSSRPLIGRSGVKSQLFQIFADQAAVTIRNAQLYQQVKTSYEKLEKAQESLIYNEKMAARGKMAAKIGHELNNILSSIYGNLELAMKYIEDGENLPKAVERLNRVASMLEGMSRFSQGLMSYSHMNTKLIRCDLNDISHDFLEFIKPVYKKTGATFKEDFDDNLPPVNADKGQIQQVLFNLVTNAIEVKPDNHIVIRTRFVPDTNRVELTVADAGPGIEKDKLDQIFVPLFTDKVEGHGYGLSICKEIAKKHGGMLTVKSKPGEGAEFTLSLPARENATNGSGEKIDFHFERDVFEGNDGL